MIQPHWRSVSAVFLLWVEIIIGFHFNHAICNIFKGCGHAELNCPTSLNITGWWPGNSLSQRLHLWFPMLHHVLLLERKWSLEIHQAWSLFNLLPKRLSGWACQWMCLIESNWQRSSRSLRDTTIGHLNTKIPLFSYLPLSADLQNESPLLLNKSQTGDSKLLKHKSNNRPQFKSPQHITL